MEAVRKIVYRAGLYVVDEKQSVENIALILKQWEYNIRVKANEKEYRAEVGK